MKEKIIAVTHNAKFHTDDVFAIAALELAFNGKEISVIRTRDEEWFEKGDYIIDIGGVYDPENNKFDHHQIGGAGERGNGIPYASFGLVWKKFGSGICGSDEVAFRIDEKLVQGIDAGDNGVDISKPLFKGIRAYTVGDIMDLYKPTWKEKDKDVDEEFLKAVEWAKTILEREVEIMRHKFEAEKTVAEYYKRAKDKKIIILNDKNHGFGRELIVGKLLQYPEPFYAVFHRRDRNNWQTVAINKILNTYETRKPFPEPWRGLRDKELVETAGVPDAVFCHHTGFMCIAGSMEGAVELANLALKP
ncbi:MAG: MYG1 family protein [bacterium]|nr:MYG1 family protein [bacterium]